MKTILFITIAFAILMLSSCGKCTDENIQKCAFGNEVNKYFGMYKPGNWWVYVNEAGDKRDSVFVTDYIEKTLKTRQPCYSEPQIEYTLHSLHYLANSLEKQVTQNKAGPNEICQLDIVDFQVTEKESLASFGFSEDKFYGFLRDTTVSFGGKTYDGIINLHLENGVYAKTIGLILFKSKNGELFYLDKYFVQ